MNEKYVNRKTYYSKSDRTASQYKITAISIEKDLDKEKQTSVIMGDYLDKIKEINFSKKISQNKANDFLCKTIFTIGLLKDKTRNVSNDNTSEANFLFIDFEEPKNITLSNKDKRVLSFDECIRILEENKLNHILKTSYSHTEEKPRLHLFLPLLKPIKSDVEYKENLQFIKDKYFSDFHIDESTKNISRWVFSSKSDTLRFSSCFEKNDIEPQKLDKQLLGVMTQASRQKIIFNPNEENLQNFAKQVKSLYGFKYAEYHNNGVIKFWRDNNDTTPNVWHSSSFYDNETNKYTIYDKDKKYNVLFSYDDFKNCINPKKERNSIQAKMEAEFGNWFIDGGKKYVVTNEGLGKSSTILKMGKTHNFIFACHTKKRVKEISDSMAKEGITHKRILSNSQILEELVSVEAKKDYEKAMAENKKLGFEKFVETNIEDLELKESVLAKYEENSQDLKDTNMVRIVTSKKLQVEIAKARRDGEKQWLQNDIIIFDEFILDEWAPYSAPKEDEDEKTLSLPNIWTKKDSYISLVKNPSSFQDFLKPCPRVLVLTTERSLVELIFDKGDYSELDFFEIVKKPNSSSKYAYHIPKFEKKLYDENVIYLLTNTTRGEIRDDLIQSVKSDIEKEFGEEFIVISNKSQYRDVSPAGVKGSNAYDDKNLLIIGTLRTEIEDNILYYSAEEYFKEFMAYLEEQGKTPSKIDNEINNYIKQVNLQTQVSQSIGRNSGFRDKGKKAVVVLPLLQRNSTKKFKTINLNYISSDVRVLYQPDIDSEESEGSDDTSDMSSDKSTESTESTKLTL